MKRTFTFISLFFLCLPVFAYPDQSRLSISSISRYPVRVVVDGRNYTDRDNNQKDVFIKDIQPGYHTIRVYQQKPNQNGSYQSANFGNVMRMLYEGRVYVKPNYHVDVLINRFGKALIDERQITGGYYGNYNVDEYDWNSDYNNHQAIDGSTFEQLKQTIRNEGFDNTKLTIAKQAISQQHLKSVQVKEIVELFSFESSKLDIAKYCYRNTIDKENYFIVNDAFSFSSSKEELAKFLQTSR